MLHDGGFRLDGGAMFGVVPRPLWEKLAPADDRHRIQLAMRPLLVEADWGRMLVDCGAGDKMAAEAGGHLRARRASVISITRSPRSASPPRRSISRWRRICTSIISAAPRCVENGALKPRFPKAQYLIRGAEWEDATHPHERNRASYLQDDFVPLEGGRCRALLRGRHDDQAGRARRAHRRTHRTASGRLSSSPAARPRSTSPT